jgi:UDP-N-acetylglucosamine 2-epimerase (non-hydrolysing)
MQANQTLADILIRSLKGLEEVVMREKPDMILVQGDTATTFAAALCGYYHKIPIGHVEAGLRTFDKWHPFPEEINRKLTTSMADLHFPPTATAQKHLLAEKIPKPAIFLTGNTVIDALLEVAKRKYDLSSAGIKLEENRKLILVTTHRRENFGGPLASICRAIAELARKYAESVEIILPVHRNPRVMETVFAELKQIPNIKLIEPLDYEPFVHLMKKAYIILTDSGGVQEEAPSLGKPVLVMREKTERPEAVDYGTVKLVGSDEKLIVKEVSRLLDDPKAYKKMSAAINPYGDGHAARRIIEAILFYFQLSKKRPEIFKVK